MDTPPTLAPTGIHETVLYAADLVPTAAFYVDVVGLRCVFGPTPTLVGLRLPDGGMLLLFEPTASAVQGRDVPSHGTVGPSHVAFSVDEDGLSAVLERCADAGVAVERELTWPRGGRSVYVRDPAGNSVEFVVGEIWPD